MSRARHRRRISQGGLLLALLVTASFATACATRTATTTWPYSSWNGRYGPMGMGSFKEAREACLKSTGIEDAAKVVPDSPEEDRFLRCMNDSNWCTHDWGCNKLGV